MLFKQSLIHRTDNYTTLAKTNAKVNISSYNKKNLTTLTADKNTSHPLMKYVALGLLTVYNTTVSNIYHDVMLHQSDKLPVSLNWSLLTLLLANVSSAPNIDPPSQAV